MHSSLVRGTVPLDLMVGDKLGGDGGGQTKKTFLKSMIEHLKTREVGGSRKPHQTEEKLALRWLGADFFLVIPRNSLSAPFALPSPTSPRSHPNHQPLKAMHTPHIKEPAFGSRQPGSLNPMACCFPLGVSGAWLAGRGRSLTVHALQQRVLVTHEVPHQASAAVDPGLIHLHHHHVHAPAAEILTRNPRVQAVISPRKTI